MSTTVNIAVAKYLRSGKPAQRTREEYATTPKKWARWGGGVPIDQLGRKEIREFLDWVYGPMNRALHAHIKSIMPENPHPNDPVFHGGGTRPNNRFRTLCSLAGIEPKTNIESGEEQVWVLKDLRKTCATYYDQRVPESSVEILGHSAGGVTYRHYAHRAPLAFKAIMTIPQPTAFLALSKGFDGECRCCRRRFTAADG